jgi:hypothetical protein
MLAAGGREYGETPRVKGAPMIQALELARERSALIVEVARLRRQLDDLINAAAEDQRDDSLVAAGHARAVSAVGDTSQLLVVLPRSFGASSDAPSDDPLIRTSTAELIVDRRVAERRTGSGLRPSRERRTRQRRSHQLPLLAAVVWSSRLT